MVRLSRVRGAFTLPGRLGAIDGRLGIIFGIGVVLVAGLLLYEHLTVARWGTTKMALAFFTLNGVISLVLGGLGIADVLR